MVSAPSSSQAATGGRHRFLCGLASLFLLVDGAMKLFSPAFVVETTVQLGYADSLQAGPCTRFKSRRVLGTWRPSLRQLGTSTLCAALRASHLVAFRKW